MRRVSNSTLSSLPMTSRRTFRVPSSAASDILLVTRTTAKGRPGSRGRTWASLAALSSKMIIRLPAI